MDFELNEDQRAFQETARQFAQDVMAPKAAEWDAKQIFPKDVLRQAGDLGFMGLYTPQSEGGIDLSRLDSAIILEELAAEFGLRTQDAVSRVQALEQMGRITGVMDDRGKFIFISRDEMAEVAAFINRKGRVAIAELARKSSDFVKL